MRALPVSERDGLGEHNSRGQRRLGQKVDLLGGEELQQIVTRVVLRVDNCGVGRLEEADGGEAVLVERLLAPKQTIRD